MLALKGMTYLLVPGRSAQAGAHDRRYDLPVELDGIFDNLTSPAGAICALQIGRMGAVAIKIGEGFASLICAVSVGIGEGSGLPCC